VIADGLGGRPTDVDGQTCLQAASTPHLDALTQRGATGLLDPVRPGVRPGSDVAHLSILGYNPEKHYPGRGVFEAAGVGLKVLPGDICFRTNFATINPEYVVLDRRAGRIQSGQQALEAALSNFKSKTHPDVEVIFKASTEHRGALILRGADLSPNISEADPKEVGKKVLEVESNADSYEGSRTADIINELIQQSYELLKDLPLNNTREEAGEPPANVILPRGASAMPHYDSLNHKYGIKSSVIAGGALYAGIAMLIGMERRNVPGATGGLDSDLIAKVEAAVDELSRVDFVFVHMKGTDSAGHDGDAAAKISFIEKIDEAMAVLAEELDWSQTHLAFTGDHCTPILYGDHTAEPVPMMFVGPNVQVDGAQHFNESAVQNGGLGRVSGNVLPMLASYCNWLKKFGA